MEIRHFESETCVRILFVLMRASISCSFKNDLCR